MTIRNDEASLRRSAANRFLRASKDIQEHRRVSKIRGLLAVLIIALVSIGVVFGVHLLLF